MRVTNLLTCLILGLRLYPPITFLQPRVTPAEGMMIAGRFVAGNVWLSRRHANCVDYRQLSRLYNDA